MTLGIVLTCTDGVVVGSDRKQVQNKGVEIQSETEKIHEFTIGEDTPLLCTTAGASTVASRMLSRVDPAQLETTTQRDLTFPSYITDVVEARIPQFAREYQSKHSQLPSATLAFGGIRDGDAIGATVYNDGTFDYENTNTAIGSGSLIAEIFLRDPHSQGLPIDRGRKLVAYIIQRVSQVDSNVEGIDVRSISDDGDVEQMGKTDPDFLTALQSTSVIDYEFEMNVSSHLDEIDTISSNVSPPE